MSPNIHVRGASERGLVWKWGLCRWDQGKMGRAGVGGPPIRSQGPGLATDGETCRRMHRGRGRADRGGHTPVFGGSMALLTDTLISDSQPLDCETMSLWSVVLGHGHRGVDVFSAQTGRPLSNRRSCWPCVFRCSPRTQWPRGRHSSLPGGGSWRPDLHLLGAQLLAWCAQ